MFVVFKQRTANEMRISEWSSDVGSSDLQPAGAGDQIVRVRAGRRIRGGSAADPGAWGNFLRVEVDYDTTDPAELFNISVAEVRVEGDRTSVLQTETFRNLTMEPNTPNNAVEVVNQGSRLVQLDRAGLTALPSPFVATSQPSSSEARRGGTECVSTCSSRWSPYQ